MVCGRAACSCSVARPGAGTFRGTLPNNVFYTLFVSLDALESCFSTDGTLETQGYYSCNHH
eukprot:469904-Prymnesium_polylepis.1